MNKSSLQKSYLLNDKTMKFLLLFAILSFFTTLFLPHIGEEGVYTISTIEMLYYKSYFVPKLLGGNYARPPLFNWLIIIFTKLLGIKNILVATRIVVMLSTVSISLGIIWFIKKIFNNSSLAYFIALIYLCSDILIKRGWLGYSDPLFSAFIFFSLANLYLYVFNKKFFRMILASMFLILAFLAKVYTAYFFFFGALFVLMCASKNNRKILITRYTFIIYLLVLLVPLMWPHLIGANSQGQDQLTDFLTQLKLNMLGFSFIGYTYKILSFPLRWFLIFLPASGILLYYWVKSLILIKSSNFNKNKKNELLQNKKDLMQNDLIQKNLSQEDLLQKGIVQKNLFHYKNILCQAKNYYINNTQIIVLLAFAIINCIPYWFIPERPPIRYIMPIYPFFAMFIGYVLFNAQEKWVKLTQKFLFAFIIIKYVLAAFWLPYNHIYRMGVGDAKEIAKDIIAKTKGYDLFVNDHAAKGLRVAAELDIMMYPNRPVSVIGISSTFLKNNTFSGFVVVRESKDYNVVSEYLIGRSKLYLVCFNKACVK